MKKAISFSLFGNQDMYNIGVGENIKLANKIYADYDVHIYYDDSIDAKLLSFASKKVIFHQVGTRTIPGYFWRFFLADHKGYDIVLFRDLDSRLSFREKAAVDEWIASGKALHIMRDHELHNHLILAGMWGIRPKRLGFNIMDSIKYFTQTYADINKKISDQIYLQQLFTIFQHDTLTHDNWLRYGKAVRFPMDRDGASFVGEVYNEFNKPKYHYKEVFL